MRKILRSFFGQSLREAKADEMARRQSEDHAIAMKAADLRVSNAQFQAEATARISERAAAAMLARLREDFPR